MDGNRLPFILFILLVPNFVFSLPAPTTDLVIVTTDTPSENDATQEDTKKIAPAPPELNSMHVESNVTNRYAHTVISSRYKNPAEVAQEATFSINLPDTAFISGFTMEIKGKVYEAYVKEKEEAKREYEQAVQSGFGAAHVEQNARDSNKFTVSVNVEPRSKVIFNLSYEELLVRKHGKYEMVINLQPGQLVKDLTVDVLINETKPLVNIATPALRSGNEIFEENINKTNEYAKITKIGDDGKCVKIHFAPTVQQQKEMAKNLEALASSKKKQSGGPFYEEDYFYGGFGGQKKNKSEDDGLSGQFIIEYDVDRDSKGGDILVNDGYFVHFFAPSDLKPLPKHAVFVLDVSGSMGGRKIEQLKEAMLIILDELNPEDYFNLVEFSFGAKAWNLDNTSASQTYEASRQSWWRPPEEEILPKAPFELPPAYPANAEYKQKAKNIIENMEAGGGTNIYDALKVGLNLTSQGVPEDNNRKRQPEPIVIFLTDGDATDGETDTKVILSTVDELNSEDEKAAIFSLAFGYDANKDFLKKLSLRNLGFMRQIYEASDAALQLQDFYKQISSPLLANVTFKYPEGQVESVTKHNFHALFDGSEFVVAGKMENLKDKILYVHGLSYDGPIDFPPIIIPIPEQEDFKQPIGPLERLWAYMTIKQLLDKNDEISAVDSNSTEAEELKNKALKLALKYSFVTPVTSLVVVKPNETEKVNAEESNKQAGDYGYGLAPIAFSAAAPLLPQYSSSAGSAGFGGAYDSAPGPFVGAAPGGAFPGAGGGAPLGFASPGGFVGGGFGGGGFAAEPVSSFGGPVSRLGSPSVAFGKASYDAVSETDTAYLHSTPQQFDSDIPELPWLSPIRYSPYEVQINGTVYAVGNAQIYVQEQSCNVDTIEGNCTLLAKCPKVFPKLDTFETYSEKYFCTLEPSFLGVCCIDTADTTEKP